MIVDDLLALLDQAGGERYGGEAVTQRQHALQCATLAEDDGCSPSLIAAALLHDIGHLVHQLGEDCADHGIDDAHEHRGQRYLASFFMPAVVEPIRLHVDAKRYLCQAEPGYWQALSPASQQSLELQGGPFSDTEAAAFLSGDHANAAIQLRRYDDLGKDPHMVTPKLEHFRAYLESTLLTATSPERP